MKKWFKYPAAAILLFAFVTTVYAAATIVDYTTEITGYSGEPATMIVGHNAVTGTRKIYVGIDTSDIEKDTENTKLFVPGVEVKEVKVPDPTAAATGDATLKQKLVGKEVTVEVPAEDVRKLAAGEFTGVSPSTTLQSAYQSASPNGGANGTCNNYSGIPGQPLCGVGDLLDYSVGAVYFIVDGHSGYLKVPNTGYSGVDKPGGGTCLEWGVPADQTYVDPVAPVAKVCRDADGSARVVFASGCTWVSELPPDVMPSPPTAAQLLDQLGTSPPGETAPLNDWLNNGLAGDMKNVCETGQNCTGENPLTDEEVSGWASNNAGQVLSGISGSIADGSALSSTDGTNTGAQQQTTGQLAGIQNSLNDLAEKVDPQDKTYNSPATQDPYAPEGEYNISDRWGSFVSNIQGSGMSDVIGNLNINPGQGTSTKTIDLGMYGGNINVDFSLFDWSKLGYILIVITGFVCTRIVVLKH